MKTISPLTIVAGKNNLTNAILKMYNGYIDNQQKERGHNMSRYILNSPAWLDGQRYEDSYVYCGPCLIKELSDKPLNREETIARSWSLNDLDCESCGASGEEDGR